MTNFSIIIYILVAVFGLMIGSFLNVIILRFDELKSVLTTRSHCPKCRREIPWYDLFPFFSYIALVGKCRQCKESISIQYPLVEVGTATVFCLLFWKFGFTLPIYFFIPIFSILIVIFTYDILHFLIADSLVWLAGGIFIIYLLVGYFASSGYQLLALSSLYGALALGGFLGLLVLISKEKWMGAGDILLGAVLGAMMGFPSVLVGTFFAFTIGAIFGLLTIVFKKKGLKDKVPFAPFLILGTLIALLFAEPILVWYLGGIF